MHKLLVELETYLSKYCWIFKIFTMFVLYASEMSV